MVFDNTSYTLTSTPAQMVDLLLSTFANAVHKNQELQHAYLLEEQSRQSIQRLNHQLRDSEANYRALLQSHPDGIVVVDRDNLIQFVNSTAEIMLQRPAQTLLNTKLDFPVIVNEAGEVSVLGTAAELIIAEIRVSATVWEGAPSSLMTFSDISKRKRTEDALRRAKEEAEAITQAKAEALATMSHEIRTPLNGIIGMADLLSLTPLTEEQSDFSQRIKTNAHSLLNIVNQTLDLSKIEARKLTLEVLDFDVHTTLDSVSEIFTKECTDKNIDIAIIISHDVPSMLGGDPGRLRQILTNLIGNAVKFTENGEVVIRVSVVEDTDSWALLHFAVSDTGIGIAADQIDCLFQSFTQVDASLSRKYGGTGLGLAISKQLAELMGGEIGVDSELGKGSMFWFTARFEKRPAKPVTQVPDLGAVYGAHVLVVEANPTTSATLASHLASWGITTETATTAAQALTLLNTPVEKQEPFAAAIIDQSVPDIDGFAFAQAVRARKIFNDLRLVMIPTVGQRGDGAQAHEVGIQAYLTKPLRRSQLLKCLGTVLAPAMMASEEPLPLVTRHTLAEAEQRPLVLVVDDNIDNQSVAVRFLKHLGYSADVANNGQEALEALATKTYAAALMDCQMPVMNGFTATMQIRQREGESGVHVPIIALTANPTDTNRERCLQAGMDDFLSKPLQQDTLEVILKKWTTRKPQPEPDSVIGQEWPSLPVNSQRSRILVVEDNETGQMIATRLLNSLGYKEVDIVASGQQALDAVASHPYAVVLMDYQLPEMDGVTATAYIRAYDRQQSTHTPIIALTARVGERTRSQFLGVGMDEYLIKPFTRDELRAAIEPWLQGAPAQDPAPVSRVEENLTV
ncbi:MAG: response regulator [Deltaproteobacteria bacterium]|nr:response regulator [Deltaproteobacteria bacterium]